MPRKPSMVGVPYVSTPEGVKAYNKAYRLAHKERIAAHEASPERKARLKVWRQERKAAGVEPRGQTEERRAYMEAYYDGNRDRIKPVGAAWRAANAESLKAKAAAYRAVNADQIVMRQAEKYAARRESYLARSLAWQKANPEACTARTLRRQARERAAPGSHTEAEWRAKVAAQGGRCTYCGGGPVVRDHVVPLVSGGTNDIGNVDPACRSCNGKKGRRSLSEFLARLERERNTGSE